MTSPDTERSAPEVLVLSEVPQHEAVAAAVRVLSAGGLIVFPTETLYGIGADATSPAAIDKLLQYKARREGKPLSIAVSSPEMAEEYVEVNAVARNLYDNFLPGPLTVVSQSRGAVAPGVASETGTLGVRIPDYPLVREIVAAFGKPITATSANASYKKRPYTLDDILSNISGKQRGLIDLMLDAGQLPRREPSTVVDTTLNQEVVLRQGDIQLVPVLERTSQSPEETQALGAELIDKYKHHLGYKSVILAMQGELGAGKTEMTKGIGRALGVSGVIQSPTFIIENEYKIVAQSGSHLAGIDTKLFHIDTWRLFESQELEALGFVEKVVEGHVFVIEWADKITGLLERVADDAAIVWVKIEHQADVGETVRHITVSDYMV